MAPPITFALPLSNIAEVRRAETTARHEEERLWLVRESQRLIHANLKLIAQGDLQLLEVLALIQDMEDLKALTDAWIRRI